MAVTPHLTLPNELRELVKAQVLANRRSPAFLGDDPEDALPHVDGEDEALFADHDVVRGHGRGVYVFDAAEAASRSLDLTAILADPDRGPIPVDDT